MKPENSWWNQLFSGFISPIIKSIIRNFPKLKSEIPDFQKSAAEVGEIVQLNMGTKCDLSLSAAGGTYNHVSWKAGFDSGTEPINQLVLIYSFKHN